LSQLDELLATLEQSIKDIIKDCEAKKKVRGYCSKIKAVHVIKRGALMHLPPKLSPRIPCKSSVDFTRQKLSLFALSHTKSMFTAQAGTAFAYTVLSSRQNWYFHAAVKRMTRLQFPPSSF